MTEIGSQLANLGLRPPRVELGPLVRPEDVAALQMSVIVDLLNRIEEVSEQVEENCDWVSRGIDADTEITGWREDDEDDLDEDDRDLFQHLEFLLAAVVSATGIPNAMLPYDQTDFLSFNNRPRASHNAMEVEAESLNGDGAEGLDSNLIG